MIAGRYTAYAYCDCIDHDRSQPGCMGEPVVYTGRNKRVTDKQRQRDGWLRIDGKDVCQVCAKRNPIRLPEEGECTSEIS